MYIVCDVAFYEESSDYTIRILITKLECGEVTQVENSAKALKCVKLYDINEEKELVVNKTTFFELLRNKELINVNRNFNYIDIDAINRFGWEICERLDFVSRIPRNNNDVFNTDLWCCIRIEEDKGFLVLSDYSGEYNINIGVVISDILEYGNISKFLTIDDDYLILHGYFTDYKFRLLDKVWFSKRVLMRSK